MKTIIIYSIVLLFVMHPFVSASKMQWIKPRYELHEWGTFTTVSGSDGVLLNGLQREEEALPSYVFSHPGFNNHFPGIAGFRSGKRIPLPVSNVKVKMETPVIYFHSHKGFDAKLRVGFNGGTISQWYPQRSTGEVMPLGQGKPPMVDFSKPYKGWIEWDVSVLSPEETEGLIRFHPQDLLQWTRARIPEANWVKTDNGQQEGFLFYRGLGSFDPGLVTTVNQEEVLKIKNNAGDKIPYGVVYEKLSDGSMRWGEFRNLKNGSSLDFEVSDLKAGNRNFDKYLYRAMVEGLEEQGLLKSESEAMVQTWWSSYFDAPGLRVFWVLPESRVDAILPLEVSPAPKKTVRVIVGRSEVIRPYQEAEWLSMATSENNDVKSQWQTIVNHNRFGLAYGERINNLIQSVRIIKQPKN